MASSAVPGGMHPIKTNFDHVVDGIGSLFGKAVASSRTLLEEALPIEQTLLQRATKQFESLSHLYIQYWVNQMPKGAELHLHYDGAIRAEDLLDMAIRSDLYFNTATSLFVQNPEKKAETKEGWIDVKEDNYIPAAQVKSQSQYYIQYMQAVSMRNIEKSQEDAHDHFMYKCFAVIDSIVDSVKDPNETANLIAIIRAEAQRQHVRRTEVMVTLPAIQQLAETFSEEHVKQAAEDMPQIAYIIELIRLVDMDTFKQQVDQAIGLIQKYPDQIVSFNIVGPEDDPVAIANFQAQMEYIKEATQKVGIPPVLHAGEFTQTYAAADVIKDRLQKVIDVGVKRIGHGVCLLDSADPDNVVQQLKDRKIAVEICLTSNDKILGVKGDRHPVRVYADSGVPIVIASDDPGVNLEDLNRQFIRLVTEHNFGLDDLVKFTRYSLEYSFLKGESIFVDGNMNKFTPAFEGVDEEGWEPGPEAKAIMQASPRATQQVKHEQDLVEFLGKIAGERD